MASSADVGCESNSNNVQVTKKISITVIHFSTLEGSGSVPIGAGVKPGSDSYWPIVTTMTAKKSMPSEDQQSMCLDYMVAIRIACWRVPGVLIVAISFPGTGLAYVLSRTSCSGQCR
jgi:hypothetical protein